MLWIKDSVRSVILHKFSSSCTEQGFLLGCSQKLNEIDFCCLLPAYRSGKYFYEPNSCEADQIIRNWAERNICFCGFIHSHLVYKKELSENDVEFAKRILTAYSIPVLWFGVGAVNDLNVDFQFYSAVCENGKTIICPIQSEIVD